MITNNLSTLKIHKLSQEQYNRELAAGTLDANALYLTPGEGGSESGGEVSLEVLQNLPNLHTWKKYNSNPNLIVETDVTNEQIAYCLQTQDYGRTNYTVDYADTINIKDGVISLNNPTTLSVSGSSSDPNDFSILRGKYIYGGYIYNKKFLYIPEDATFTISGLAVKVDKAKSITLAGGESVAAAEGFVSAENKDAYPTSGQHTDGYWYEYYKVFGSSGIYIGSGEMPEGFFIQIDPNEDYKNETPEEEINGSGKTLIGELELNSTNLTVGTQTGQYVLGSDLQTIMTNVFTSLSKGFDVLAAELIVEGETMGTMCSYILYPDDSTDGTIYVAARPDYIDGSFIMCEFDATYAYTNQTEMISAVLAGDISMNVKFYTISGGSGSSSGNTSVVEEELPEVTYQDNGKVLMVVDGKWAIGPINNNTVLPGAEGASF